MGFKTSIRGADKLQRGLGRRAANRLHRRIDDDIKDGVERMMEGAHDNAPIESGALKQSILSSLRKDGDMEYVFGTTLPYGRRQEYEHKSKKFFFRRAIIKESPHLRSKVGLTVRRVTGGM